MGLSARLTSWAVARAHVLPVEVPGWWSSRVAVERTATARGWPIALSPADADVLVVCGEPGERLAEVVDRVWDQLPGPRARVAVLDEAGAGAALDEAATRLRDTRWQGRDAGDRAGRPLEEGDEMAPAGIPLAGGYDDRDGLEMDVLRMALGPVLPHWPAGLVLRCALHGDVVTGVGVDVLGPARLPSAPPAAVAAARAAAARCDDAARLLTLAGWEDAAADARRIRDRLLDRTPTGHDGLGGADGRALDRLRIRVERSRTLCWQLGGLGELDDDALDEHGLPDAARGDVRDRLCALLAAAAAPDPPPAVRPDGSAVGPRAVLDALPALLDGLELGTARLVLASLAPDVAAAERSHA